MKKIILASICMISVQVYSQLNGTYSPIDILNVRYYDGIAQTDNSGKVLRYEDIIGTPYVDKTLKEAKISDKYPNVNIRYNAYKDEIEFRNGENLLVLPKEEQFNRIEIISPKQVLVYKSINGEPEGYYYELVSGKTSLYKKTGIKFTDFKLASNPYASDQAATFTALAPDFYLVVNNQVIKNPKKEKEIIEMYNDKKDHLKSFFKQNIIKLNDEQNLIKLVKFLNK